VVAAAQPPHAISMTCQGEYQNKRNDKSFHVSPPPRIFVLPPFSISGIE
jgi:hypothetical protein